MSDKLINNFYNKLLFNLKFSNNLLFKDNSDKYSYNFVHQKIKKLLFYLKKYKNKNIMLMSDKSIGYYIAVISIVFSGNTWIQISPNIPKTRIRQIAKISNSKIAIIDSSFKKNKIPKLKSVKKLELKKIFNQNKYSEIKIPKINKNKNAMIFFTSGSTGLPKGVQITYENFISCLNHQIKNLDYTFQKETFSDYHDNSFVMSLVVIFPAIILNSTISPINKTIDKFFPSNHIINNKVSILITVPSFMLFMKQNLPNKKIYIKNIILCGENFPPNILKLINSKFSYKNLFNCYGSTETSPWAFFYKYKKKDNSLIKKMSQIPIGKPFKGVKIKIDHEKQLYISGNIISPGYLDKSKKLDKGKFLKIKGRKFYNTGDVVVKKNNLYFCKGRNDTQIKIKGYRVDTTEIEKVVKKIKDIDYTYCYANNKNNSSYLVLIIISKLNLNKFEIVKYLQKFLPAYMIPQEILILKKIKFNKNGKVDKAYYKKNY